MTVELEFGSGHGQYDFVERGQEGQFFARELPEGDYILGAVSGRASQSGATFAGTFDYQDETGHAFMKETSEFRVTAGGISYLGQLDMTSAMGPVNITYTKTRREEDSARLEEKFPEVDWERWQVGRGPKGEGCGVFMNIEHDCRGAEANRCVAIGFCHERGYGVSPDGRQAASFYEKACREGVRRGCLRLALLYSDGPGVRRDEAMAAQLFQKACGLGSPYACYSLGRIHEAGRGVSQDPARAIELYRQACAQHERRACVRLEGPPQHP